MIRGWRCWRQKSDNALPLLPRAGRSDRCRPLVEALEDRRLLTSAPTVAVDSSYQGTSIIVQFRDGATYAGSLGAYVAGNNLGQAWAIAPGMRSVHLSDGVDVQAALAAYRADPNVLFAEPDYRIKLSALSPNDPDFEPQQWDMHNTGQTGGIPGVDIRLLDAWDVTRGDPSIVVGVIDSGIDYDHPDLYQNIWLNQGEIPASRKANLVDVDGDGRITFKDLSDPQNQGDFKITDINGDGRIDGADILAPMEKDEDGQDTGLGGWADGIDSDNNHFADDLDGYDFANHDADPMDDYYHGTHIAGTIAAVADNGVGIAGVAPNVQLMPLKFLDDTGNGDTVNALSALDYAVANGASITNNSWGGGPFSQALLTAIQNAASHGHIFVAAAGNENQNADTHPFYPANYDVDNIISVAATDVADNLAWFSNHGVQTVDLAAPGVDIYSTLPTTETPGMLNEGLVPNYGLLSGTSMAAPHVTGAVALVRSIHSDWTPQQVIQQILSKVVPVASLIGNTVTGGRLDVAGALGIVQPDTFPPHVVRNEPTGPTTAPVDHLRFTFSEPIDPNTFDANDMLSFNGPNGPIAVLGITAVDSTNRVFNLTFDPQSAPGDYSLVIGPHITDAAGNEIDQNGDGVPGVDGDDNYTATFTIVSSTIYNSPSVPVAIAGLDSWGSYLTIDDDLTIADVNVKLNLSFPRDGNLAIWLVSPAGDKINLSYRHGGSSPDFDNTVFDDEAATPISSGAAPFAGSFQPDDPLSVLSGQNAHGIWELFVQNVSSMKNHGTLNSWSLNITQQEGDGGCPGGQCFEDDPPSAVNDTQTTTQDTPLTIDSAALLANDSDPNDDFLRFLSVGNAKGGSVVLQDDGSVTFTPNAGSQAAGSFNYVISDGLLAAMAKVTVNVQPFYSLHNPNNPWDVNNDGKVTPIDAMLVINRLNSYGPTPVTGVNSAAATKIYYDVVADNLIANGDAISVINRLNSVGPTSLSSGEGEAGSAGVDVAAASPPAKAATAPGDSPAGAPPASATPSQPANPPDAVLLMTPSSANSAQRTAVPASANGSPAIDQAVHAAAVDQWLDAGEIDSLLTDLRLHSRGGRRLG